MQPWVSEAYEFFELGVEVAVRRVLQEEVEAVFALLHAEALDDVGVVQHRVDLYFADQLPTRAVLHHRAFVHHLRSHQQVARLVAHQVDLAEAALAYDVAEVPVFLSEVSDDLLLGVQVRLRSRRSFFEAGQRAGRDRGFFEDGALGVGQVVDALDLLGRQVALLVRRPEWGTLGLAAVLRRVLHGEACECVVQCDARRLVARLALRHRRVGFHDVQD